MMHDRLRMVALAAWVAAMGVAAGAARAVTLTEYPLGSQGTGQPNYHHPGSITSGPDGRLWFTDNGCDGYPGICQIGAIATDGTITEYGGAQLGSTFTPDGIVAGTDCNLWFTENAGRYIGRMTPAGALTQFPTGLDPGNNDNDGIAVGPDGNVWFIVDTTPATIARITPTGAISRFSAGLNPGALPNFITAGPDGNLWFTDDGTHAAIGRVTPNGVITEFSAGLPDGSSPQQIAAGPDGDVWFSDRGASTIGRVTPSGAISEDVSGLVQNAGPAGLALGPDGNLWFADASWYAGVGMVSPSGTATEWSDGQSGSVPDYIAAGADGNMWFTDYGLPAIWKVTLPTSHGAIASGCPSSAGGSGSSPGGGSGSGSGAVPGAKGDLGPKLIHVRLSNARWREPGGARRAGVPIGTTFTFDLNTNAIVRFTFIQKIRGRWVGRRCRAVTDANRRHRTCRLSAEIGVLATRGRAGRDRVVFHGRLDRRLVLRPGSYTVLITATNAGGRSTPQALRFTILG
jgi:streptogramin lyase